MTNAAAVSRRLRQAGFNPVGSGSRNRQGLRVTRSMNRVRVVANLDSPRAARDLAIAARQALIGAGYRVEANADYPSAFYVTR